MQQEVETVFTMTNRNMTFNQKFNQCTFINADPTNSVWINKLEVPVNTQLLINLNVGEVNKSQYEIDFRGSTSANLQIVYSQYML